MKNSTQLIATTAQQLGFRWLGKTKLSQHLLLLSINFRFSLQCGFVSVCSAILNLVCSAILNFVCSVILNLAPLPHLVCSAIFNLVCSAIIVLIFDLVCSVTLF